MLMIQSVSFGQCFGGKLLWKFVIINDPVAETEQCFPCLFMITEVTETCWVTDHHKTGQTQY